MPSRPVAGASQRGHKTMQDEIKKILNKGGNQDDIVAGILRLLEGMPIAGRVRITTYKAGTMEILRQTGWTKNLIVSGTDTGRNLVAQRLGGINTYTLNVTHADIGTGTNPPANSDTQLQTPVARAAKTNAIISNNIVTLQFFFSDALLPNGTYNEFGTFIDGTGTLSSGKLFNRVLFGTAYTKASGEDTTIEVEWTITSA